MGDAVRKKLEAFRQRIGADKLEILPFKFRGYDVYVPAYYKSEPPLEYSSVFVYVKGNEVDIWTVQEALSQTC